MKPLAIARVNVLRLVRDRSNLFFVFILPLGIVVLIGAMFGGGFTPSVGVATEGTGLAATDLTARLADQEAFEMVIFDDREKLVRSAERGDVDAGVIVPSSFDQLLGAGDTATVEYLARPNSAGPQLQATVQAVVADMAAQYRAARFASGAVGVPEAQALDVAAAIGPSVSGVEVVTEVAGESLFGTNLGQFDLGATQQLVLFMFLTGLTGAAALIQTRQLGVSTRMLSTPTSAAKIILGEGLGRYVVVLVQGVYIVMASLLMFGVNWGDPVGALAVILLFGAVCAGFAMLSGSLFRNDQQAGGMGVILGLGFAALGGSMVPIEIFPETMRRVAHITPHAWALDAFAVLVRRDGTLTDIMGELGVLALYAIVLLAVASWRLRRVITRV